MLRANREHPEWLNPDNWSNGMFGLYFSRRDPRLWVPKRIPAMGWTVNLGHPKGGLVMTGMVLLAALVPAALLVTVARTCG